MNQPITAPKPQPVRVSLMRRVFIASAALATLSLAISVGGRWAGAAISLGGHSEDTTPREVVIGNDVVVVAANAIRYPRARHDGVAPRLDLYLRWPDMTGYSRAADADFNHAGGSRRILFLSFERRAMSRDMSGRLEPVYRALIQPSAAAEPAGVSLHAFRPDAGFGEEELAVAQRRDAEPFVARCMTGPGAEASLASCERDIAVGQGLSLTYRFPRELMSQWSELDDAVRRFADAALRGGA